MTVATALPEADQRQLTRHVVAGPTAQLRPVVTPMTAQVVAQLPLSTPADVARAVEHARQVQPHWARRSVTSRAEILVRFHDAVLRDQVALLDLIQLESGKARLPAFEEVVDTAVSSLYYGRHAAAYLRSARLPGIFPLLTRAEVIRHPVGVVGVVSPWNYPLSLPITDSLPALVAGNAVVLRPDPQTTLTALHAVGLLREAGLPEGVLQVVTGDGPTVGQAVVDRADYVCFTGSTRTGRAVARAAGERLIGSSLELGGKNTLYVRADADLGRAVEGATRACFSSAGQLCMHAERVVVHDAVADEFLARLEAAVRAMRLGTTLEYGYEMGSLLNETQLERTRQHVADALHRGARLLAGGRARPEVGPFVHEPTLLTGVTAQMACHDEETFGPVVAVHRVADDAAAVARANDTPFGLNASIWTRDVRAGRALARRIRAGTVNINEGYAAAWGSVAAPMGGRGQSGTGRRHGAEGILRYTESQNVTAQHLLGFGPPFGLSDRQWAGTLTGLFRALKATRIR